ncbi:MAG: matrixin family metalloprotease, partial [Candidatus Heimdallarchaeota archaeon]|nr:matrixin family metalloprotease [Candidatus Heimdallarchaeota archaeon]
DEILERAGFDAGCETAKSYSFIGAKWQNFPITYSILDNMPANFVNDVKSAIGAWEEIHSINIFLEVEIAKQPELVIQYHIPEHEGAVAETYFGPDFQLSDLYITTAEVTLNSHLSFENIEFSCEIVSIDYRGPFDLQAVIVHELGHVLGLDHTVDDFATMFRFYNGSFQKTLSQGEIDGFYDLYNLH